MSGICIGIRRETKSYWERRVALVPEDVRELIADAGVEVLVQPDEKRAFSDSEYEAAGALLAENLSPAQVIFGVKEIPEEQIEADKVYIFFSHTIKGQKQNMPMLRRMAERRVSLVDYECVTDEEGRRLVFFGRHAGYAGMVNALKVYGERLQSEGRESAFTGLRSAWQYGRMELARGALREIGRESLRGGGAGGEGPLVVGFAGYGHVSQGAQSVLDELPVRELAPAELLEPDVRAGLEQGVVHKVIFREEHLVRRADGSDFDLQEYYDRPELYESVFGEYLPHLDILINAIFWTERYPRLLTLDYLRRSWANGKLKLRVIGDISMDLGGAIECSVKTAESDSPCYVYEPGTGRVLDGVEGDGPVIMAVDNLPCEIPVESSQTFSHALEPLLPGLLSADWSRPFEQLEIPPEIRRGLILHRGELTPPFRYMEDFLKARP